MHSPQCGHHRYRVSPCVRRHFPSQGQLRRPRELSTGNRSRTQYSCGEGSALSCSGRPHLPSVPEDIPQAPCGRSVRLCVSTGSHFSDPLSSPRHSWRLLHLSRPALCPQGACSTEPRSGSLPPYPQPKLRLLLPASPPPTSPPLASPPLLALPPLALPPLASPPPSSPPLAPSVRSESRSPHYLRLSVGSDRTRQRCPGGTPRPPGFGPSKR
mmetsp:Transcript_65096/g.146183  ORF Transcript_65096/g.146183 Transcript_65096/m.146183 type:complete len:213 (+) Transcript_65096:303-941(+)